MESTPPVVAGVVTRSSLAAAFATVPDPRRAASVVYPLPAILTMAVAAILANHLSVLAIAEWGARQDAAMLAALGFPTARTPCQSTLQRLFRHLDGDAVAATLTACFRRSAAPATSAPAAQGVAIDGKAQRGRLRFTHEGCPVHALSAFCHDCGVVRAHEPMAAGPDKPEAELSVAPDPAGARHVAGAGADRGCVVLPNGIVSAGLGGGWGVPAPGQGESGHTLP